MDSKSWRITGLVNFPRLVVSVEPPEPGSILPKKIGFQNRLENRISAEVVGLGLVSLAPSPYSAIQLGSATNCDLVALSLWVEAPSPESALSSVEPGLELLLDDMSFQLQWALRVLMLEVIDVTPPLEIGEDRSAIIYPFPIGWTYPKFQESVFQRDCYVERIPSLRRVEGLQNRKTHAALRWYVKALATPWDVDRFAFFWITLEILCSASPTSVEKPYVARCGHTIDSCPQCGESTVREVQGATLILFLEELGVQPAVAKELWSTRQMFHGNNDLTKASIETLSRLVLILKSAAAAALKGASGMSLLTFPKVFPDGPATSKTFVLGGTRKLESYDLCAF